MDWKDHNNCSLLKEMYMESRLKREIHDQGRTAPRNYIVRRRGDDIGLVSGGLRGVKDIYDVESSASCADRQGGEVGDAKLWHGVL